MGLNLHNTLNHYQTDVTEVKEVKSVESFSCAKCTYIAKSSIGLEAHIAFTH